VTSGYSMADCDRVNKTIGWATAMGRYMLGGALTSTPSLDAELILGKVLKMTRTGLHIHSDRILTQAEYERYMGALKERLRGVPVSYITGQREFMSLIFSVSEDCLIPRAETETLVEKAIERIIRKGIASPRILEIGTGSGCIAVALGKYLGNCHILATDISPRAAEIARVNIASHGLARVIEVRTGDLYDALSDGERGSFDAILSNPPYISIGEISELPVSVRDFEPSTALWTDEGGTMVSRRIIEGAGLWLKESGFISIEINPRALDRILALYRSSGYRDVEVYSDLAGFPRVATGERQQRGDIQYGYER